MDFVRPVGKGEQICFDACRQMALECQYHAWQHMLVLAAALFSGIVYCGRKNLLSQPE
jgi:hypothetical protein